MEKEIDISKTIMDTIKLLEEQLEKIKEVDNEKYGEIRTKLDDIYEQSKNKSLNVFETVNSLMKLQNDTITFLDTNRPPVQESTELTIYKEHKKGFLERLFEKFISKIKGIRRKNENLA